METFLLKNTIITFITPGKSGMVVIYYHFQQMTEFDCPYLCKYFFAKYFFSKILKL